METKQLQLLYKTLDDIRHENGTEYWFARELCPILGYGGWDGFLPVIERAKESCKTQGIGVDNHFQHLTKMVEIGSGAKRPIDDIRLTRYACYLTALNGDPTKEEIAFAQAYFVSQTRKMEVLEEKVEEIQRITARNKLKITEKEFASLLWEKGLDGKGIGEVRDAGDHALFGGFTTKQMKQKLGAKDNVPLANVLPSVTVKAKDLATEMTTVNTKRNNLSKKELIKNEHIKNNSGVRKVLVDAGIKPEELPAAEDITKIERKHQGEKALMAARHKKEIAEAQKKNDYLIK